MEEFLAGKEYRFLIMGDEIVGILHRVPANVVGDGVHTIEQLIHEKNKDSLRGKGYRTQMEQIQLGVAERMFLKIHSRNPFDIPRPGEVIFLREEAASIIRMTYQQAINRMLLNLLRQLGILFAGVI